MTFRTTRCRPRAKRITSVTKIKYKVLIYAVRLQPRTKTYTSVVNIETNHNGNFMLYHPNDHVKQCTDRSTQLEFCERFVDSRCTDQYMCLSFPLRRQARYTTVYIKGVQVLQCHVINHLMLQPEYVMTQKSQPYKLKSRSNQTET